MCDKLFYIWYVVNFIILGMWQTCLYLVCDKLDYTWYVTNLFILGMWPTCLYLVCDKLVYTWYVTNLFILGMWKTCLSLVCDKPFYLWYVTNLFILGMWQTCLYLVCDKLVYTWYVTNLFILGMWQTCLYLVRDKWVLQSTFIEPESKASINKGVLWKDCCISHSSQSRLITSSLLSNKTLCFIILPTSQLISIIIFLHPLLENICTHSFRPAPPPPCRYISL